jgi:hypothetical protein
MNLVASVSSSGGQYAGATGNARLSAEYSAAVLKKQKDVVEELGAMAVELIQQASVNPQVGRNLDISA